MAELFPTKIRASAIGLMVLFGRMGASLTGFFTDLEVGNGYHPYAFIFVIDLIALCPF